MPAPEVERRSRDPGFILGFLHCREAGNLDLGKCCGSGSENVAHDEDLSLSLKSPPSLGYGEFCPVELPRLHPWIFEVIDLAQK